MLYWSGSLSCTVACHAMHCILLASRRSLRWLTKHRCFKLGALHPTHRLASQPGCCSSWVMPSGAGWLLSMLHAVVHQKQKANLSLGAVSYSLLPVSNCCAATLPCRTFLVASMSCCWEGAGPQWTALQHGPPSGISTRRASSMCLPNSGCVGHSHPP